MYHGAAHHQDNLTDEERRAAELAVLPVHSAHVNGPISFDEGPFRGRTIRAELIEVQHAEVGRKFAQKDRRPLDPPTVVEALFFETRDFNGVAREIPLLADEIDTQGLLCFGDVFSTEGNIVEPGNEENPVAGGVRLPPDDNTNKTLHLAGNTFVSAAKLPRCFSVPHPPAGRTRDDAMAIYFVFGDLSVHVEGTFFFRYRMFDLMSREVGRRECPIMAETYGKTLTVYSTKDFPGLKASTALTKHLALHGVKLNFRESERRRKRGTSEEDAE